MEPWDERKQIKKDLMESNDPNYIISKCKEIDFSDWPYVEENEGGNFLIDLAARDILSDEDRIQLIIIAENTNKKMEKIGGYGSGIWGYTSYGLCDSISEDNFEKALEQIDEYERRGAKVNGSTSNRRGRVIIHRLKNKTISHETAAKLTLIVYCDCDKYKIGTELNSLENLLIVLNNMESQRYVSDLICKKSDLISDEIKCSIACKKMLDDDSLIRILETMSDYEQIKNMIFMIKDSKKKVNCAIERIPGLAKLYDCILPRGIEIAEQQATSKRQLNEDITK